MWKVSFSQTGCSGNLTSRLGWVASSSREQTAWDFCLVVQQLARLFSFWHAWHVCNILAACKPRATREIQLRVLVSLHNLEKFFTLSHTLPLHDSHLNTGLLITKIQANLEPNKANKMVDKIQPYRMYLFFLKSKEHINVCVERKTYKQNEAQYKNKSKLSLSLS